MVKGLDVFAAFFAGHEANYALIGGVATQLVLDDAGLPAWRDWWRPTVCADDPVRSRHGTTALSASARSFASARPLTDLGQ